MSDQMNTSSRVVRLTGIAYIVAIGAACLFITFASMVFIDTTKCGAVSRAMPVLLIMTAVVLLASVVVVGVKAKKIISDGVGCLAVVAVYAVVMLASFVIIAFGLLVAFNC